MHFNVMHDSAMTKITYYFYCIHSDSDCTTLRFTIAEDLLYCVLQYRYISLYRYITVISASRSFKSP